MRTERLLKEQSFHDARFGGDDAVRKDVGKYYSIFKYVWQRYVDIIRQHCRGKTLLEYGCGTGDNATHWLKLGATLTGIDISTAGIKKAKAKISNTDQDADFYVMDAENTEFAENSFDMVIGTGIIHHLDLKQCYQELSRILKAEGQAVFIEPLGHNPVINLYRTLTPQMRTEDEHPLEQKDIHLLKDYFHNVQVEYFFLLTLLSVPFRKLFFFNQLCAFFRVVDKAIFLVPGIKKYAWIAILHISSPKNYA